MRLLAERKAREEAALRITTALRSYVMRLQVRGLNRRVMRLQVRGLNRRELEGI